MRSQSEQKSGLAFLKGQSAEKKGTDQYQKVDIGQPLRVVHLVENDNANAAYYFKNLFGPINATEVECSVVTIGQPGTFVPQLERYGIRAAALGCNGRRSYWRAVRQMIRLIRHEKIDIIHAHTFDTSLISYAAVRLTGKRLIMTRHYSVALHLIPERYKRKGHLMFERLVYHYARHVIAPSVMVREILIEREGVLPANVSVIPHPLTKERFDAVIPEMVAQVREELNMEGRLAIVYVARLDAGKGHRYLFEALAQLIDEDDVDAMLYLAGAGPEENQLKAVVKQLNIEDRVRFLGWRDDPLTIIAAADLVVHPSLHEALPQAVIEAVAMERPLIATNVSGVRDIIGDEKYGMIVPPADAEALRRAINLTIANLEDARERARQGRLFVLKYMDADRVAREHVNCYRHVAGKN
jgi:glycosyltransferase involved in cell wall biosynthesis